MKFAYVLSRAGPYYRTLQTGPTSVFQRGGGNRGKKRQTPSLPVLNLPPHVQDDPPEQPAPVPRPRPRGVR